MYHIAMSAAAVSVLMYDETPGHGRTAPVKLESLVPKLNAISNENHDAKIYIRGDRANSWGTMMEVLGAVGGAGYSKVGLVSSPADGTSPKRK